MKQYKLPIFSKGNFQLFFSKSLSAALLGIATIKAQENTLVQNLETAVVGITKILGDVGRILINPAVLLNGQLGENVAELVDHISELVADLLKTVADLLIALGLATN